MKDSMEHKNPRCNMKNKIDSDESLVKILKDHTDIVIYGAGNYGTTLQRYIKKKWNVEVVDFAVTEDSQINEDGGQHKVALLESYPRTRMLIIAVSEQHQNELIKNARRLGFDKFFSVLNEYVRYMQALLNDDRLMIKRLLGFEVHITEHCNLNCRGCYHFSPLAKEEYLDINEFERDLRRIYELCEDNVERITLLGGEPLLHPDINRFIEVTRKIYANSRIEILTNGLLLPKMEKTFWKTCGDNHVSICCTKYPISVDYEGIEKMASDYGLFITYHNDIGAGEKTLIKYPFDITGSQDKQESFDKCTRSNLCITLKHGRLYTCPMAAHAHLAREYFDLDTLQLSDMNGIDIYRATDMKDIMSFFTKPIDFCRYCNLKRRPVQMKWDISQKKIEEWF